MQRTKQFVLMPVEIETYESDGETVVGVICSPTSADVEKALKECNTFMSKDDAWAALTK